MKGLIVSDFLLMRRVSLSYLLIVTVFAAVAAFGSGGSIFFVVFFSYFALAMVLTVMDLDERAGWPRYVVAGSSGRKQYVLGKFCSAWILLAAFLVLFIILRLVRNFSGGIPLSTDAPVMFFILSMMVAANASLSLVQFPVTFRFGTARGRLVSIVVIVIIAVGTGLLSGIGNIANSEDASSAMLFPLPSLPVFSMILLAISLVFYAVSVLLSLQIFSKKEL